MKPKRTAITNYYDCYEVGYIKLGCVGNGNPDHQDRTVITRTLNLGGVQRLANVYGIKFVNNDDIYATGYYIKEVETTKDPDTFVNELDKLDEVFMEEAEYRQALKQIRQMSDTLNYGVLSEDEWNKLSKELDVLVERSKELDRKLHY